MFRWFGLSTVVLLLSSAIVGLLSLQWTVSGESALKSEDFSGIPIELVATNKLAVSKSHRIHVAIALKRLQPPQVGDWAKDIHALRLWGNRALFSSPTWSGGELLDTLLNSGRMENQYPAFHLYRVNRFGVAVKLSRTTGQVDGDPHRDKILSVLALLGIPASTRIEIDGVDYHIRDLLTASIADFSFEHELPWTAIAYALYLTPLQSWKNRFGTLHTFDELADSLCALNPAASPALALIFPIRCVSYFRLTLNLVSSVSRRERELRAN
jgi:hypothetical protein